jgi:hypothetical protein
MTAMVGTVAAASVTTNPEPDLVCPAEHGTGRLTEYTTTVETPADSDEWYVSVTFTIENDGDTQASCELTLATYELPSAEFSLPQTLATSDTGTFAAGTHTLTAALPRQGEVETCYSQYDFAFGPALAELTESNRYADSQIRARIVGSETCDLEEPAPETTMVMVMKHVCPDAIQTAEQFDALGGFLQKVLACPVITLPGDNGPDGALDADDDFFDQFVEGGATDFNFGVAGANGGWDLSAATFIPARVCETDVNADANGDGTISPDICVEVSHYAIDGVAEGAVTITETMTPSGFRFGDIEFTPNSGDAETLVSIDAATGAVNLDTTADDATTGEGAAGPSAVMLHVYNFANLEGEQPGNPPTEGNQGGQPPVNEGVQGSQGGPGAVLPDTASPTSAPGIAPVALLAVFALVALLSGVRVAAVHAQRRR